MARQDSPTPSTPSSDRLQPAANHEFLEGQVAGIVYENPETGFAVIRLLSSEGVASATGALSPVHEGEHLRLHGWWEKHPKFGRQFRAAWSEHAAPSTLDGLERYLGSGAFPGIGPDVARKLVAHFGEGTLQALESGGEEIRQVEGIGPKRAATLLEVFQEGAARHRVMAELRGFGLGGPQAKRVYEHWGPGAVERVRKDPYLLIGEVRGIGFETAEKIGRAVGIPPGSEVRARGVALHLLREAAREGHACVPESFIIRQIVNLEVEDAVVAAALQSLKAERRLLRDDLGGRVEDPSLYLPDLHEAEAGVAEHLRRLLAQRTTPLASSDDVMGALTRTRYLPDPSQRAALEMALQQPVAILTGGPGTGKTTTLRLLLEILEAAGVSPVRLASPTGRAAKRLQEATGRDACTLHRLLRWDPSIQEFQHNENAPLELRYLVVDEVSMLDLQLAHALLRALPSDARLLLVGDADQLPSVGAGSVLADLLACGAVPSTRLSRIHRQGEDSGIVEAAHRILSGQSPVDPERDANAEGAGDFFIALRDDPEEAAQLVERLVTERIPQKYGLDPLKDVLVLAPMYRGPLGVNELNRRLGLSLNPGALEGPVWANGLRVGDRVMIVRNDYDREVFNGDAGRVLEAREDGLLIEMDGGRLLEYGPQEMSDLIPSWCVTVHRAQGSEARAVVVVLGGSHWLMLRRNLLYTAITRGRELVVLVTSRAALRRAVANDEENRRHGLLRQRLGKWEDPREAPQHHD